MTLRRLGVSEAADPPRRRVRIVNQLQTIAVWIAAVSLAVLAVFSGLNYFAAENFRETERSQHDLEQEYREAEAAIDCLRLAGEAVKDLTRNDFLRQEYVNLFESCASVYPDVENIVPDFDFDDSLVWP